MQLQRKTPEGIAVQQQQCLLQFRLESLLRMFAAAPTQHKGDAAAA